jgi:tetratricopeptide (TPR) repeat protein
VLEELSTGRGAVIAVTGEPGVGKSRLTQEVHRLAGRLAWLQVRCLSYGSGLAYKPYADLLERVEHPDDPYFAALLGRPAPEIEGLEPEVFRHGLHRAVRSWLADAAQEGPVVLAIEDLHWADASSAELTSQLARLCPTHPLLVYLTAREEGRPALEQIGEVREIRLQPLEPHTVEALISGLLEGAPPPRELTALVLERAGGNPFFAGELVRSLKETGALRRDPDWILEKGGRGSPVPATVEGVVSARLDLLEPSSSGLLQTAAVIGRRVPLTLLSALEDGLEHRLEELERRRFLDRGEDETVVFHHALVQEVVYGRMPRRRRRTLHARVAQAAEAIYGGGDEYVDLLARHLYLAGGGRKAIGYLRRAGERARRLYANEEAIAQFRMAVELVAETPGGEIEAGLEAALQEELGDTLELIGSYVEAEAAYREAVTSQPDSRRRALIHASLGTVLKRRSRYDEAKHAFADAEADLGPEPGSDETDWWRAWLDVSDARFSLHYWLNEVAEMEPILEQMRLHIDEVGTAQQRLRFFGSLMMLGLRRERCIPSDETLAAANAALAAGLELGDDRSHFNPGFCRLWRGELAEAESHITAALEAAERVGDALLRTRSLVYLAIVQRKRLDVVATRELLARLEPGDVAGYDGLADANRAWVALREGNHEAVEDYGQRALRDWEIAGRSGPAAFAWTARWPLLAAALVREDRASALEHARAILSPSVQPPPEELGELLRQEQLERGLELARVNGYA